MLNRQYGIALIQILIIVAVMSVLSLYLMQSSRSQLQLAFLAKDRGQAEVELESAKNLLLFELLTKEKVKALSGYSYEGEELDEIFISNTWNFYGKPFSINEFVTAEIQDQSGLLNLNVIHIERFSALLVKNGVGLSRANQIIDSIIDWQDSNNIPRPSGVEAFNDFRNGPIVELNELDKFIELTGQEKKLIENNTTIYHIGNFNPMTATIELIAALSNEFSAQQVEDLRNEGFLTSSMFKQITNIRDQDDTRFHPSNIVRVKLTAAVGEVSLTKEFVLSLAPYVAGTQRPYQYLLSKS